MILKSADAICFGTLAQRNEVTRKTILKILKDSKSETIKVLDINLRQDFYNRKIIEESLRVADILKINDFELKVVNDMLNIKERDTEESSCLSILNEFNLKLVCLTKGEEGSLLVDSNSSYKEDAYTCKVKDTVGAGDAFAAAMIIEYLKGSSLEQISRKANRLASRVTSQEGAMPL